MSYLTPQERAFLNAVKKNKSIQQSWEFAFRTTYNKEECEKKLNELCDKGYLTETEVIELTDPEMSRAKEELKNMDMPGMSGKKFSPADIVSSMFYQADNIAKSNIVEIIRHISKKAADRIEQEPEPQGDDGTYLPKPKGFKPEDFDGLTEEQEIAIKELVFDEQTGLLKKITLHDKLRSMQILRDALLIVQTELMRKQREKDPMAGRTSQDGTKSVKVIS